MSEWTVRAGSTAGALESIVRAGFDCVELALRAGTDQQTGARAVAATGLRVTSICPLYGADADFAAADPGPRTAAADLLRRGVEYAATVGAGIVIVVPSDTLAGHPAARLDRLQRAADSIAAVAQTIPAGGPQLVIEPLNAQETSLVTTLDQAEQLAGMIGRPCVGVMADLYHLHHTEAEPLPALQQHAQRLRHVHLAETDRRAPGTGDLDFAAALAILAAAGYRGALVLECLPADVGSLTAARRTLTGLLAEVG